MTFCVYLQSRFHYFKGILFSIRLVVLMVLFGVNAAYAQTPVSAIIEIGENILISADMPNRPHIEPYIATNPIDPNNLVVGSIMISETGTWTCAAFASFDGGESWTRTTSNCKETSENCGDPWLAFGKDNTVYLSVLTAQKDSSGKHVERIVVFRSEDGGKTWLKPSFVPLGEGGASFDHPSIVVDHTAGPFSGTIYTIATQSFRPKTEETEYHHHPIILSHSTDQGRTFSNPNRILPNNLVQQAGSPVVLSDGTVVLSFFDFAPWNHSSLLKARRYWVVTSPDNGKTLTIPAFIAEFPNEPRFPTLAVDSSPSSPYRDRLYTTLSRFQSDPRGIYLTHSIDRGRTWTKPVRVSDSVKENTVQRIPALAVIENGVLGIIWYDSRRDSTNQCFDMFFAISLDGGETFLPNVRVSNEMSCSNVKGNIVNKFDVAERWPVGGDYIGLASSSDGLFHAVWADSRNKVYQLWTTTIRINAEVKTDEN